jgi:outer membrane lipoprotein SlyB
MAYYALQARVEVAREDNTMYGATTVHSEPVRHDERRSLYVTSGAMFAGLAGLCLFAAPGGLIGAILGALAGAGVAQVRLHPGA